MRSIVEQLEVRQLAVELFDEARGRHQPIVTDLGFQLRAGMGLGITGESGSGKTTLSLALGGLLPPAARVTANEFRVDLASRGALTPRVPARWNRQSLATRIRGLPGRVTFTLFQEPRASLNPYRTIGWQLERCRRSAERSSIPGDYEHSSAEAALAEVGLACNLLDSFPHELSTGMCQRVFLAMAWLRGSSVLVADEPFASVDAATQELMVTLVSQWMRSRGMMLVLVSHNLDVLRRLTNQTVVLYRGQVAECGPTDRVLSERWTAHPYTKLLVELSHNDTGDESPSFSAGPASCCFAPRCRWADPNICIDTLPALREVPRPESPPVSDPASPQRMRCVRESIPITSGKPDSGRTNPVVSPRSAEILRVHGVTKDFGIGWFGLRRRRVLSDVSFHLRADERLAILGPSGHGKSTLARLLVGVLTPTAGHIEFGMDYERFDVATLSGHARRRFRRSVQLLHQDADLSLDPAARVNASMLEAYRVADARVSRRTARSLAARLIEELALPASLLDAFPYRLSGGERKRVALARCLAALGCPFEVSDRDRWRVLILDEPTAGLDVVVQAILARFLRWAQRRMRLSYLVISHDEEFVRQFCHRTLRLEHGHVVETNHE